MTNNEVSRDPPASRLDRRASAAGCHGYRPTTAGISKPFVRVAGIIIGAHSRAGGWPTVLHALLNAWINRVGPDEPRNSRAARKTLR
jgi:hypothetical protein